MKKIIFSLILFSTFTTSCSDQLDVSPITAKEANNFYKTEIEIEEAIDGAYAALQFGSQYGLNWGIIGEIASDITYDEVPANDNGKYGQLDEFTTTPSNETIAETWRNAYVGIQRTNVILSRIDAVPFASETRKNARKGEMKFIRALTYFNLVQTFGDVPIVTKETTDPSAYFGQGRTAQAAVYDQIIKDLTEAINELPAKGDKTGKVIKTAAQTLLGKAYLTQKKYAEAKTQLDNVINSKAHTLLAKVSDVFEVANETNNEIIFSVQFASGISGNTEGSIAFQQRMPSGTVSGAKGHSIPTRTIYNLFAATDKRRTDLLALTTNGIPFSKKLKQPTTAINDGGSDWIVLRYADVLLMAAEVENELNNATKATEYLNLVKKRSGIDEVFNKTKAELTMLIDLERQFELLGEGHRWFDLIRTGKAVETMNAWFRSQNKNIQITNNNLVLPIPQSQINTDPSIKQNTGY